MFNYNDADHIGDTPSPEGFVPGTPECSEDAAAFANLDDALFTPHAFPQAGISVTDKGISNVLYIILDYSC
jgi:hypothetical protein